MIKKFSKTILWGEYPEPDAEPIKYEFNTQRELDAFIHGVNECDGWWGFEEIDTTQKYEIIEGEVHYAKGEKAIERDKDQEAEDDYWDNHPEEFERSKVITIQVKGGCVVDVLNLPNDYLYNIDDRDVTEGEDDE